MSGRWGWATVTQVSPLRVRMDGESTALPVTPTDLTGGVAVGGRVRVHFDGQAAIVTGAVDPYVPRTAYVPTLTGATLGNGTLTGAYARQGAMVFYEFRLQIGSTTAITSALQVSVPIAAPTADSIGGSGVTIGIGPNATEVATVRGASTTSVYVYLGTTGSNIGGATAITSGDTVRIVGSYMAA